MHIDVRIKDFDQIMAVNVRAAMIVGQVFARSTMAAGTGGANINVSSISSAVGFKGIRVNTVNSIVTLTPMAEKDWGGGGKAWPAQDRLPIGRFVEPEEVADTICYLHSDGASAVSGVSLPIDGGSARARLST